MYSCQAIDKEVRKAIYQSEPISIIIEDNMKCNKPKNNDRIEIAIM